MMINSTKFSPSFKKKLVAKANVLKNNQPCPVSIYQLEKKEDKNYLKNLQKNDKNWLYSFYLDDIKKQFEHSTRLRLKNGSKLNFYTLEDNKQNCLGLVEIDNKKRGKQNIKFIETFPENNYKNEYKYVGETILTFLAKQQKVQDKPRRIIVDNAMIEAQEFYLKSHFKFMYNGCTYNQMYLPQFNDDLLLESNRNHTKSEIELVV